jgi:hypothetical protein
MYRNDSRYFVNDVGGLQRRVGIEGDGKRHEGDKTDVVASYLKVEQQKRMSRQMLSAKCLS